MEQTSLVLLLKRALAPASDPCLVPETGVVDLNDRITNNIVVPFKCLHAKKTQQ